MEAQIKQLMNEIIDLSERLRRETEESLKYYEQGDSTSALRNTNDNRDELRTLETKWDQLTQLLNRR